MINLSCGDGNAYIILAHAYIAAKLNILAGADAAAVQTYLVAAHSHLVAHCLSLTTGPAKKSALRNEFLTTVAILDEYNNGYIGPGHCSSE